MEKTLETMDSGNKAQITWFPFEVNPECLVSVSRKAGHGDKS